MRLHALFLLFVLAFVRPLAADCVAQFSMDWSEANDCFLTTHYYGSNSNPAFCPGTEISLSVDGGPFNFILGGAGYTTVQDSFPSYHSCWTEGVHTFQIRVDCYKLESVCVRDTPAYSSDSLTVHHGAAMKSAKPGPIYVDSYNSRVTDVSAIAGWSDTLWTLVQLGTSLEMTRTLSTVTGNTGSVDTSGAAVVKTGLDPHRPFIKVTTSACDKMAFSFVSVGDNECGCPACGDCQGGPIRVANGNMRYSDTDPLPAPGAPPLTRTYDSTNIEHGWFGHGWSSFLDEWLRTESEADGSTTIAIGTGSGDRYFFNGRAGVYRPLWPQGRAAASLTLNGSGAYVLRPYGSTMLHSFDGAGRIERLHDVATDRNIDISYDTNGLPAQVSDSWGNWSWTISTDATNQRITNISIPGTPISWTYGYDESDNLTSVQESGVDWRTYTYGGALTEIHDGAGNLIESHAYGADGATTSIGQTDDITSVVYNIATSDPGTKITRITNATGATTDYYVKGIAGRLRTDHVVGGCNSCSSRDSAYAYDDAGRLLRQQDARGYIVARSYDELNRVITETTALKPSGCDPETATDHCRLPTGLAAAPLDATSTSVTTSTTYDDIWYDRPTSITTTSVLQPSGTRVETMTYDAATGEVLTHAVNGWSGSASTPVQETHTTTTTFYNGAEGAAFNPGGTFSTSWLTLPQPSAMRKSIDGPRTDVSDVTTFVYYPIDSTVPAALRGHLAATRNAAGHVGLYEDYDVFGHARRVTDPNGVATELTFDHLGRVVTTTLKGVTGCSTLIDPLCATDLTSSHTYTPATGPLTSQADASGNVTAYEYDARGRLASMSRGPSLSDLKEQIAYSYDTATGRKSMERYLAKESSSWVEKRRESFTYDPLAQLVAQTHPDTTDVEYTYDPVGSVATVRDENHTTANTAYAYDPARRLSAVTQALSSAPGGAITTSYGYDLAGNLVSVTDPNGNTTTYVYDDFGRMLSQSSPVTGTTSYGYDLAGNLVTTTDANGATTTRTYDVLGRATSSVSTRGAASETVTWTYDGTAPFALGRLAQMTDPVGITTYGYDRRGLLLHDDAFYQYDESGNRTGIGPFNYTYDYADRPLSVQNQGMTVASSATYLPYGPLTSLAFANGTTKSMTYDARYRPVTNELSYGATLLSSHAYCYDAVGNVTAIGDQLQSSYDRTFGYDDLNRLTTANSGTSLWGTGSYTYDPMGNMLTSTLGASSLNFAYQGTTSKLASVTGVPTVTYDAAGNEVSGSATYSYTPRNLVAGYGYDGRGVRVRREYNGTRTTWTYTPELRPLSATTEIHNEFSWEVASARRFVWFGDLPVAQIDAVPGDLGPPEDVVRYTFTDHLGTPIVQTDDSASIIWRAEHDPYGRLRTLVIGDLDDQPLRLPGQMATIEENVHGIKFEAGEYYNIFRWYRSGWGRYVTADPIGLKGGANLYSYVRDNPVRLTDPVGLAVNVICRRVDVGQGLLERIVGWWLVPVHCRLQVSCPCSDGEGNPRAPFNVTVGMEATAGGTQLNTDQYLAPRYASSPLHHGPASQDYTDGWFSVPVTPPAGAKSCTFERCILNEARWRQNSTPQAFPPYAIPGPNSNSYVRNLVDTCGGSAEWPYNAYGADPNNFWGGNYKP